MYMGICKIEGCDRRAQGAGIATAASPTLDKIIPELGYVRGNIAVISHRANRIKSDATLAEVLKLAAWLEKQHIGGNR
jgi:hypothetical protein